MRSSASITIRVLRGSSEAIGSSATLQNSQCAVGFTTSAPSGTSVVFTITLALQHSFSGSKSVYLLAQEPITDSGWVLRGTWTVP